MNSVHWCREGMNRLIEFPPRLQLQDDEAVEGKFPACEKYLMKNILHIFSKSPFSSCSLCSLSVMGESDTGLYLTQPSDYFKSMLSEAKKIFDDGGKERLCSRNMRDLNLYAMIAQCNTKWIECVEHGATLAQNIFKRLISVLTRERCDEIINIVTRRKEDKSSNIRKIVQQASKAKWYYFYQC